MPLYEYFCQPCNKTFEVVRAYDGRDSVYCPDCGARADRQLSLFGFKMLDNFHKASNIAGDGEGFSSVVYHPDEYKERVKYNAGKYD